MPAFQVMTSHANACFSVDAMDNVEEEKLAPGRRLCDIMDDLGLVPDPNYLAYLDAWPIALQEAIRAVVYDAMCRSPRIPVHFAWAPAYDYGVKIWEAHSTTDSTAAITIMMESPYPGSS